jgi:hypothetical protein
MAAVDPLNVIKDVLIKVAPSLAAGMTGNLLPAVIGILAEVFGVKPNADSVAEAMRSSDPEVIKANLHRAEAAFKADAERSVTLQKQIDSNVEMMRMNLDRGFFYSGWRMTAGWAAVLFYALFGVLILFEGFQGSYAAITHAFEVSVIGVPLAALAGVVAWQRSEERKAISNNSASLQEIIKSILG